MQGIRRVREREEELSRCEIGGGEVGSSRGAWRQLQWDAIEEGRGQKQKVVVNKKLRGREIKKDGQKCRGREEEG